MDRFAEPRTPVAWVAILRILLGLMFIFTWVDNLEKDLYTPEGLEGFLNYSLDTSTNPVPIYEDFIRDIIIPITGVFAPFQLVTELLMGIALLMGFMTRPAALASFFFLLNTYLISVGVAGEWAWSYYLPMGMSFVVLMTGAGRALGVDAYLAPYYDRWLAKLSERIPALETFIQSADASAQTQEV